MSSSKSDQSSSSSSLKFERSNSNDASENSSRGYSENGSKKMEIGKIDQRLKLVEEEDQIMKERLLKGLEERRKLMNDIHKEFQEINNKYIQIKKQEENPTCTQPFSIKHLKKERSANGGLLQVLCQESNPLLVTRHFRPQTTAAPAEISGSSS